MFHNLMYVSYYLFCFSVYMSPGVSGSLSFRVVLGCSDSLLVRSLSSLAYTPLSVFVECLTHCQHDTNFMQSYDVFLCPPNVLYGNMLFDRIFLLRGGELVFVLWLGKTFSQLGK